MCVTALTLRLKKCCSLSSSSVIFSNIASKLLCPLFNVSERLFEAMYLPALELKELWIPLLVGIIVGLFSVLVLYYYRLIDKLQDNVLRKIPHFIRIFVVLSLTALLGTVSYSFVSTGHHLMLELFESRIEIWLLLIIILVRTTLTLGANSQGLTGGIFIPLLTLGALVASALGQAFISLGVSGELYTTILALGITACIAGGMKMPITAIVFSLEALSCYNNVLPVIITSFVAYLITETLGAKSMSDTVIELREDYEEHRQKHKVVDTYITVQKDAFAIGKQIRDIFWPRNLFVLSLQHADDKAVVDEHGGKEIRQGDILHVRYSTANDDVTREELYAIVGEEKEC